MDGLAASPKEQFALLRDRDLLWQQVAAISPELVRIRRLLHQFPELGFEEFQTAELVAAKLRELGLEVSTGIAKTGVVGLLRGSGRGPTVGLRADMDALPIQDQKEVEYASKVPGKMHACGHDGHTTVLLGVAKLLSPWKGRLPGNIKFIFQPAEEGPGGAMPMIEAGILENPPVDIMLGLHLNPDLEVGKIGIRNGMMNAAADGFELRILGEGGHGAHPDQAVDAIWVAAQVISALQGLVSREVSPNDAVVVTVGTIHGGYRSNVIADEVVLTGTVRTVNPLIRAEMEERMKRLVGGITSALRGRYELLYRYGYPPLLNDDRVTELVRKAAAEVLGPENVVNLEASSLGAEDFAYFAEKVPSAFFRLGGGNKLKGFVYPGHHPRFDFDEEALMIGVAVMTRTVINYLVQA